MRQTLRIGVGTILALATCMLAPANGMQGAGHPLLLIGVAVAVILALAVSREAWRHQRLAESIARLGRPATIDGKSVTLVPGLDAAFVAGLRQPRIFCAEDLGSRLDPDELRAVILHEHHHQIEHGPARLVLIGTLTPVLGRFGAGRAWLEQERARLEIAADAYALDAGASRHALASALLKLAALPRVSAAPGFASAADLRVRALLGEVTGVETGAPLGQTAAAFVLVASCVALYLR